MRQSTVSSSLAADAYGVVKRRLVRGEVRLGQSISRRKLAAELGMSFLPVSIALLRLEYEGFLESRPRAGTRVRIPSREDLSGHYVVREALEMQAAKLFAVNASKKEREELRKLAAQVDELSTGPDRVQYVRAHQKFHRRVADGARCSTLTATIEHTHALASIWFCAMGQQKPQALQPTSRRHQELAVVLTEEGSEQAAEAMREHIAVGLQHAVEALKPYFSLRKKSGDAYVRSDTPTM